MALFRLSKIAEPEPLLRGDGIYLRPAVSGDFSAWVRLRSESREFLTPWEPIWPEDDLTRAAFRRRLRRQSDEMARDEAFSFLIFDAGADTLLGGLTLGGIRRGVAQSGTLGYWMGAPHAGKGRMTRAVAAAVRFGFSALRLHRIEAACLPENSASQTLLERNGFQREGLARSYLRINGAWRDHLLYALVEPEAARLG
ncbi:MAG TPA: GNAT family protein [Roseiarcus sp.]|jgi:ribosomal-protein-alanine N-acetyltransferase